MYMYRYYLQYAYKYIYIYFNYIHVINVFSHHYTRTLRRKMFFFEIVGVMGGKYSSRSPAYQRVFGLPDWCLAFSLPVIRGINKVRVCLLIGWLPLYF